MQSSEPELIGMPATNGSAEDLREIIHTMYNRIVELEGQLGEHIREWIHASLAEEPSQTDQAVVGTPSAPTPEPNEDGVGPHSLSGTPSVVPGPFTPLGVAGIPSPHTPMMTAQTPTPCGSDSRLLPVVSTGREHCTQRQVLEPPTTPAGLRPAPHCATCACFQSNVTPASSEFYPSVDGPTTPASLLQRLDEEDAADLSNGEGQAGVDGTPARSSREQDTVYDDLLRTTPRARTARRTHRRIGAHTRTNTGFVPRLVFPTISEEGVVAAPVSTSDLSNVQNDPCAVCGNVDQCTAEFCTVTQQTVTMFLERLQRLEEVETIDVDSDSPSGVIMEDLTMESEARSGTLPVGFEYSSAMQDGSFLPPCIICGSLSNLCYEDCALRMARTGTAPPQDSNFSGSTASGSSPGASSSTASRSWSSPAVINIESEPESEDDIEAATSHGRNLDYKRPRRGDM